MQHSHPQPSANFYRGDKRISQLFKVQSSKLTARFTGQVGICSSPRAAARKSESAVVRGRTRDLLSSGKLMMMMIMAMVTSKNNKRPQYFGECCIETPLRCGWSGSPTNTMFLGPPRVLTPNSILICSAVFAQWSRVEPHDRQTYGQTPRWSVTIVYISCIRCII